MSNDKSERIHKRCHVVFVRRVQIPLKLRCRYITPSHALHLLTCMLVHSCLHTKSWSCFDNFRESPSNGISNSENRFSSAVSLPCIPLNINTNTVGPSQRHIIKINRASTASEETFEEVYYFFYFLSLFLDKTKSRFY